LYAMLFRAAPAAPRVARPPYTTLFRSPNSPFKLCDRLSAHELPKSWPQRPLPRALHRSPHQGTHHDTGVREKEPIYRTASAEIRDRKSTRLNSSHVSSSYAVFGLKKKN